MTNEKTERKEKLLQILADTKTNAENVIAKAQAVIREGRYAADVAAYAKDIFEQFPSDSFLLGSQWDDQIDAWSRTREIMDNMTSSLSHTQVVSSATTSTFATSTTISYQSISALPPDSRAKALIPYEKYQEVLTNRDWVSEIGTHCVRLGINSSKMGAESVVSLILQAKNAFDIPSFGDVSAAAVLIPIRSAIDRACADLLPRRIKQEKTGGLNQKVKSICEQSHHPHVNTGHVTRLVNQAPLLYDDLSKAKDAIMTRDHVRELMNRALLFLVDFLQIIDESKLRT